MKQHVCKLVALAVLAVALTGTALAGSNPIHASIPFDFSVGSQSLSAGEYTIMVNSVNNLVTFEQDTTGYKVSSFGSADDGSRDGRTTLTFNLSEGGGYALRELQSPERGLDFNMKTPKQNGSTPTIVQVR